MCVAGVNHRSCVVIDPTCLFSYPPLPSMIKHGTLACSRVTGCGSAHQQVRTDHSADMPP